MKKNKRNAAVIFILICVFIYTHILYSQIPDPVQPDIENYNKALNLLKNKQTDTNDCTNEYINAAFHYALSVNNKERKLLNRILKNGGSFANCGGGDVYNLSASCRVGLVKIIMNNGASVNSAGFEGRRYLYAAVQNECMELVKFFISKQADVNYSSTDKETQGKVFRSKTPLLAAIEGKNKLGGDINIIRYLLKNNADPNLPAVDPGGKYYPLYAALAVKNLQIFKELLHHGAKIPDLDSMFIFSVIMADPQIVKFILSTNKQYNNDTPLIAIKVIDVRERQLTQCEEFYKGRKVDKKEGSNECNSFLETSRYNHYILYSSGYLTVTVDEAALLKTRYKEIKKYITDYFNII